MHSHTTIDAAHLWLPSENPGRCRRSPGARHPAQTPCSSSSGGGAVTQRGQQRGETQGPHQTAAIRGILTAPPVALGLSRQAGMQVCRCADEQRATTCQSARWPTHLLTHLSVSPSGAPGSSTANSYWKPLQPPPSTVTRSVTGLAPCGRGGQQPKGSKVQRQRVGARRAEAVCLQHSARGAGSGRRWGRNETLAGSAPRPPAPAAP